MSAKKGSYPLVCTTYLLLLVIFLMSKNLLSDYFIISGIILSCLGFVVSWHLKGEQPLLKNILRDISVLGALSWMVHKLLISSFLLEEIIFIFTKGIFLVLIILSFFISRRRDLASIQILSLTLFMCLLLFVDIKGGYYKFLFAVYISLWLLVLRLYVENYFPVKSIQIFFQFGFSFCVALTGLAGALLLREHLPLSEIIQHREPWLKSEYMGRLWPHPGEYRDRLHTFQDALYDKLVARGALSTDEKKELINSFIAIAKKSFHVREVEEAREGLIDFLQRPGRGFEKGDETEITYLLSEYIDAKINDQIRNIRQKTLEEIQDAGGTFAAVLSSLWNMINLQRQKSLQGVQRVENALEKIIAQLSLNKEEEDRLKEEIKQLVQWKIYSLYNATRSDMVLHMEKIPDKNSDVKKAVHSFFNEMQTVQNVSEGITLERNFEVLKSVVSHLPFDPQQDIRKKLEEMLFLKLALLEESDDSESEEPSSEVPFMVEIREIILTPESVTLALGENSRFTVYAIGVDGVQYQVTKLVSWRASDPTVVSFDQGKINTLNSGETLVYAYMGDVESRASVVTVENAKLLTIGLALSSSSRITPGETFSVVATGFYSDGSKKDITSQVHWNIENEKNIISEGKGTFRSIHRGTTAISASYGEVESPSLKVVIIIPPGEIFRMTFFLLCTFSCILLLVLYLMVKIKVITLKKLMNRNPPRFIVELYGNGKKVYALFGLPTRDTIPLFTYARFVEEKFTQLGGRFSSLTRSFSKIVYSSYNPTQQDALAFLSNYNECMEKAAERTPKRVSIFLRLLVHRLPFIIG